MERHRAHVYVSGRVQGVFFRASAVEMAHRVGGLAGWARNMPDGRVEVVCEGPREEVERLISWLGKGPELAHVTDVEVRWEGATGAFTGFDIRR